jgi:MFS family permease
LQNAVIFFSSSFFAAAGLSNATMASALIGVCNIIGTSCAASYMDRVGRKPLLAGSFACMATCMVILGMAITRPLMCLSFTLLYILAFACGAGPIPAIIISDILPPELRGKAASLALSFHWIANAVVGQLFLPAVNQYGFSSVFNFFAAFAASATLLVLFKLPETIGQRKPALAD